jgi:hypothetical protein
MRFMLCLTRLQGVDLGKRRGQGDVEFALTCFITHVLPEYDSRQDHLPSPYPACPVAEPRRKGSRPLTLRILTAVQTHSYS